MRNNFIIVTELDFLKFTRIGWPNRQRRPQKKNKSNEVGTTVSSAWTTKIEI